MDKLSRCGSSGYGTLRERTKGELTKPATAEQLENVDVLDCRVSGLSIVSIVLHGRR